MKNCCYICQIEDELTLTNCIICKGSVHQKCWSDYVSFQIKRGLVKNSLVKCPYCRDMISTIIQPKNKISTRKDSEQYRTEIIVNQIRDLFNDIVTAQIMEPPKIRKFLEILNTNKIYIRKKPTYSLFFGIEQHIYRIWLVKRFEFIPHYYKEIYGIDINFARSI